MNKWPVKKLGEVADYINGYPFSPNEWDSNGLPIIRIQNLNDSSKEYNCFQGEIDKKYLVNPGDILISWSASLGVYLWNNYPAWLNQHIFKVSVNKNEINNDYFFYIVQTKIDEMKSKVHGGTMQHITKGVFEKIMIPVPSIQIQKKIVERLDAIRKTQELCDQQIQKTEELFEAILDQLYFFDEKLQTIGDLAFVTKLAGFEFTKFIKYQSIGEIVALRALNIKNLELDLSEVKYISGMVSDNLPRSKLFKNEIVMTFVGTIGRVALIPKNDTFHLGPNVAKIKVNDKILPKFLLYFLITKRATTQLLKLTTSTSQGSLSMQKIRTIKVQVPPISKQRAIVERLEAVQNYKKLLVKQKGLLKELFDSVLDKSMNGEMDN